MFKNNGATRLTTSRVWEYVVRLHSIANVTTNTPSSHRYAYDALNRRVGATLVDGSRWAYDYNDRNELVSARRLWADQSPVSGQQFQFAFDNIGNLKTNWSGGDVNGMNLRSSAFTVNNLNQYSSIAVPGYRPVTGVAHAAATVTVAGQATDRKGEHYHRELTIANGSGPVWTNVTVTSTTNLTGNLLVPPATRTLTYDDDGNLTADGLWTYQWDGENRLKQVESAGTVPEAARRRLVLTYDHMGRRSTKKVYGWSGGGYSATPSLDLRFVYDAWNLVAELNAANNNPIRSYVWGQDLSGSLQGAGGIGGLLLVRDHGAGTYHFAGYDGNGNVTVLVNAADQSLSAHYEYSPFGDVLRATGPLARSNPFRFSTKFLDEETDLVYYGYRYYSPSLLRWVSRDPIDEDGGHNLYAFLLNSPTHALDPDGRTPQELMKLAMLGGTAQLAADLFGISSITAIPNVMKLKWAKNSMQIMAMGISMTIDVALGGRLLKNVGGRAGFAGAYVGGASLGFTGRTHHQSLAKAVVAGRLEAVSAIGVAAAQAVSGKVPPGGDELRNAAHGYLQAARRGDTAWADLDAALMGVAIGNKKAYDPTNAGGFLLDILNRDVASAFSRLGSYQALNAWDMAIDMQDMLEGM